jgi:hypothetical protein
MEKAMSHHVVRYASDYLVEGVTLPDGPGFHQITLTWNRHRSEADGTCYLDPNICGVDEFGDPTFCTKIAILLRDMQLSPFDQKPGYHAYTMKWRFGDTGSDYEEVPLRVVTIAEHGQNLRVRLLVLKSDGSPDGTVERVIELHEQQPD